MMDSTRRFCWPPVAEALSGRIALALPTAVVALLHTLAHPNRTSTDFRRGAPIARACTRLCLTLSV